MARPQKQTADYFPHYAVHGKTMFVIEAQYGVAGFAAWFKMLEQLCLTPGHCYYAVTDTETEYLTAKMGFTDTETWLKYMETLVKLEAIDKELWQCARGIWCQNLVDNLAQMYSKRKDTQVPVKPVVQQSLLDNGDITPVNDTENPVSTTDNPQSKVKETIVDKRKVDTTTLLGYEVEQKWFDELQEEYKELDLRHEEKRCYDWWTGQRKSIKNAKNAMRNWCINQRRFNKEKDGGQKLPDTADLKKEWGHD